MELVSRCANNPHDSITSANELTSNTKSRERRRRRREREREKERERERERERGGGEPNERGPVKTFIERSNKLTPQKW